MIENKNGDCCNNGSAGMLDIEANLLVQSKHYDVKDQKFACLIGKSSSHDSSNE